LSIGIVQSGRSRCESTCIHARRKIFFTNKSIDKNALLIIDSGLQQLRVRIGRIESSSARNSMFATSTSSS